MPRIRSIKPELFDDPDLGALPVAARWVFVGLLTQADKRGRLVDDPRRLKVRICAFDDSDMNLLLEQLAAAHLIIRYRVEEHDYIQVRTFEKHQRPHGTEKESVIPAPHKDNKERRGVTNKIVTEQLNAVGKESGSLVLDPGSLVLGKESGSLVSVAPIGARHEHKDHACCGKVCLPSQLFRQFVQRGPPPDPEAYVRAFFRRWDDRYTAGDRVTAVPEGSDFAFWRARWTEDHPGTSTNAKTAGNLSALAKFIERGST